MTRCLNTRWRVPTKSRLRPFLAARLTPALSVRQIKNLLDTNRCQVNGIFERFGSALLSKGDLVEVVLKRVEATPPAILYEDAYIQVLDKPAGLPSERLGEILVHRLDRDTSGVLLLAKTAKVAKHIHQQFRDRAIKKVYLAVVVGTLREMRGELEHNLGIVGHFSGQKIWGVVEKGKLAKMSWELVRAGNKESLVRCLPVTGRTHQIRVQLAELGFPLVGDGQYGKGGRMPGRHLLHAVSLSITHPESEEIMTFTSALPKEFQ